MTLGDKNILLISPESWDHIFVSKHHYAVHLAKKGNRVFFLNPPGKILQRRETEYDRLSVLDYSGLWKGLYRLPKILRIFNQRRVLKRLEQLAKTSFEVVWSFDNSVFYDMGVFGTALKISHIVDLNQDFQTARAAASADLCFGVIPQIVGKLQHYNLNTHLIRHGVDIFPCRESVEMPGSGRLKVLYFGNFRMPHLDWSLLQMAAVKENDLDFILVGSGHENVPNTLRALDNIYLLEPVPSNRLSCFMNLADILILFYKPEYYESYASPHKMMEYLSSGKPIVASYTGDYREHEDLILMAKSSKEWLDNLSQVAANSPKYSIEELAIKRKSIASNNTYESQVRRIEDLFSDYE